MSRCPEWFPVFGCIIDLECFLMNCTLKLHIVCFPPHSERDLYNIKQVEVLTMDRDSFFHFLHVILT